MPNTLGDTSLHLSAKNQVFVKCHGLAELLDELLDYQARAHSIVSLHPCFTFSP